MDGKSHLHPYIPWSDRISGEQNHHLYYLWRERVMEAKTMDASDEYKRLDHVEHILVRPDSYVGSVEYLTQTCWVFDRSSSNPVDSEGKLLSSPS